MEIAYWGNLAFTMFVAEVLGKYEYNDYSNDYEQYLWFLTPLVKLFTAKESVKWVSEGLECFGGVGYVENSGIPWILWDT